MSFHTGDPGTCSAQCTGSGGSKVVHEGEPKRRGRSTHQPSRSFVRLCYYALVRTTLDISDEAYYIAKAIARDRNRSLGRVVGDLILQSSKGAKGASIQMSDYGMR